MVDILEHLHRNYVPMSEVNGVKTPADFVCFGGDQLTEERSRNIQKVRADGRSVDEKLDGVWYKNEDWHGIRIAYQVFFCCGLLLLSLLFFLGGGGGNLFSNSSFHPKQKRMRVKNLHMIFVTKAGGRCTVISLSDTNDSLKTSSRAVTIFHVTNNLAQSFLREFISVSFVGHKI